MKQSSIVVIDLGGTKINVGLYRDGVIMKNYIQPFDATQNLQNSLLFIKSCVQQVLEKDTVAVAMGCQVLSM